MRLLTLVVVLATAGCALDGCATVSRAPTGTFQPVNPGTLTVATSDLPAPGFWEGPPAGPDGGLEQQLAQALATRFGLPSVRVVQVPFARIVAGDLGGADLALAQITPTPERAERLDFSAPYLDASPAALVRTGTQVRDLNAAQQLRWAAQQQTTLASALTEVVRPGPPVTQTATEAEAIGLLDGGQVDAVLLDLPDALVRADRSGGRLGVPAQLPTDDNLAAALPKSSPNAEAVGSAIRGFVADGTIDRLSERWLGTGLRGRAVAVPVLRISA